MSAVSEVSKATDLIEEIPRKQLVDGAVEGALAGGVATAGAVGYTAPVVGDAVQVRKRTHNSWSSKVLWWERNEGTKKLTADHR